MREFKDRTTYQVGEKLEWHQRGGWGKGGAAHGTDSDGASVEVIVTCLRTCRRRRRRQTRSGFKVREAGSVTCDEAKESISNLVRFECGRGWNDVGRTWGCPREKERGRRGEGTRAEFCGGDERGAVACVASSECRVMLEKCAASVGFV